MPAASPARPAADDAVALIAHEDPDTPLAWRAGRVVTAARYLGDVTALATRMPGTGFVVSLCEDRYLFAVTLGAALLRGLPVLLPPARTPAVVERIRAAWSPSIVACDAPDAAFPGALVPGDDGTGAPGLFPPPRIPGDRIAAVLFTSGSTGEPVPTPKSWASLRDNARAGAEALGVRQGAPMSILGTVPAQHSYGFESTVLIALHGGHAFHAGRPLFPADVAGALAALPRPRMLVTTPVHLRALLEDDVPLPPADLVVSATAPLPEALAARAEHRFAAPLVEIYGCSEAGQLATRRTVQEAAWTPMRGVRLWLDATGTWTDGGHVPRATRLADVIEIDPDGRFRLLGRDGDMVDVAGKRHSLAALDRTLAAIPGVLDGAFLAPERADGRAVRLMAFVVAPGRTEEEILAALRAQIDPAFLPRPLVRVERLPRNDTGKLPREALLALAARRSAA